MPAPKGIIPWNKGLVGIYTGEKNNFYGKKHSDEARKKMSIAHLEMKKPWVSASLTGKFGDTSRRYKKDRTQLAKKQTRNDPAYKGWRLDVWLRDRFKCRIANEDCIGRIEAHHILGWSLYPELRYNVRNGITLCHAHHPKKRAEEKRLVPVFQGLVPVS